MLKQTNFRAAVFRPGAQNFLLISLISFAGTVMLTRLYLTLTGFPKIGRGELHIAHVLWGGLILFIAALLPLIYANRWIITTSAFLSGVGVGLFIDEVGKFITMRNDYFYPPAAPIIYAVFLLTVLVYLRVRKPPAWDARTEFYFILEGFKEVLDHDLEPAEKNDLLQRLQRIVDHTQDEDMLRMASSFIDVLHSDKIKVVPERLAFTEKTLATALKLEKRFINRSRMRTGLTLAMLVVGGMTLLDAFSSLLSGGGLNLEAILLTSIRLGEVRSQAGATWFFVHIALQIIVGILALLSAGLIITSAEKRGLEIGTACLVLSLTMVSLLTFFVDQFSAAFGSLGQLLVLLALLYYRRRFLHIPAVL